MFRDGDAGRLSGPGYGAGAAGSLSGSDALDSPASGSGWSKYSVRVGTGTGGPIGTVPLYRERSYCYKERLAPGHPSAEFPRAVPTLYCPLAGRPDPNLCLLGPCAETLGAYHCLRGPNVHRLAQTPLHFALALIYLALTLMYVALTWPSNPKP